MIFKKFLSAVCIVAIVLTMCTVVGYAEESVVDLSKDKIYMNNDTFAFDDLVLVKDDTVYLPIRMIFPNSDGTKNGLGTTIAWGPKYGTAGFSIVHGSTTGEKPVNGKPVFKGERVFLDIILIGDLEAGATGYITYVRYEDPAELYSDNGGDNYDDGLKLSDPVYVKQIAGGDRVFVSIDDIKYLSELLKLSNNYNVKFVQSIKGGIVNE
ncbi:MAG: hypothetical protein II998_09970 [Clostridia bacterium]|nr:hypothetical protein [Clostridia bacterium]